MSMTCTALRAVVVLVQNNHSYMHSMHYLLLWVLRQHTTQTHELPIPDDSDNCESVHANWLVVEGCYQFQTSKLSYIHMHGGRWVLIVQLETPLYSTICIYTETYRHPAIRFMVRTKNLVLPCGFKGLKFATSLRYPLYRQFATPHSQSVAIWIMSYAL